MPITLIKCGQCPTDALWGQSGVNMTVLGQIDVIVKINKIVACDPAKGNHTNKD
jgi:hypothetical protein